MKTTADQGGEHEYSDRSELKMAVESQLLSTLEGHARTILAHTPGPGTRDIETWLETYWLSGQVAGLIDLNPREAEVLMAQLEEAMRQQGWL